MYVHTYTYAHIPFHLALLLCNNSIIYIPTDIAMYKKLRVFINRIVTIGSLVDGEV